MWLKATFLSLSLLTSLELKKGGGAAAFTIPWLF